MASRSLASSRAMSSWYVEYSAMVRDPLGSLRQMGHRCSSDNTKPVVCRKSADRCHNRPSAGRGIRLTTVSKLRWGNEVPADVNAARERLLDAAETCIDRFGLAKTTVEDIAAAAKVSR